MSGDLIVESWEGGDAAALLVDGQLEDFVAAPRDGALAPGAVHRARVAARRDDIGLGFLDLADDAIAAIDLGGAPELRPGSAVVVQISAPPRGDKPARARSALRLEGQCVVLRSGRHAGVTLPAARREDPLGPVLRAAVAAAVPDLAVALRSAAFATAPDRVAEEALRLARVWRAIAARAASGEIPALLFASHSAWRAALPLLRARPDTIRVGETRLRHALAGCLPEPLLEPGTRLFDAYGVGEQLAAARQQRIDLSGGGSAMIESTRALTAIDIDSGSGDAETAALAVARALGRWLRLRDVVGTIMVDFPRANAARRRILEQAIAAGLSRDRRPVAALGWTRGGLYELSRSDDMAEP